MTSRTYAPRGTTYRAPRPASEKQTDLIGTLAVERQTEDLAAGVGGYLTAFLNGEDISTREASDLISALFEAPRVRDPRPSGPLASQPDVPAGRYALDLDGMGELDFVQIDRPTKGKWSGYTFAKRLVGAPGDFREIRFSRADSARVLAALEADRFVDDHEGVSTTLTGPRAAAVRFSRRFRVCSACLSPLTDPESRAAGLGPVCRTRY